MERLRVALSAGFFLTLAALTTPAKADLLSLAGSFSGNAALTPSGTPGIFVESLTGTGTDGTFGAFTITGMATIDFSHPPNLGVSGGAITLAFSQGTLGGSSSGSANGNGHGMAAFTGTLMTDDGTGIFAGFSGDIDVTGTIALTSATTASVAGNFSGTLATPEPETIILLGTVCAILGLSARRVRLRR